MLHQRGRLTQPACDAQVQGIMSDQSSPIRAFVEQHCLVEEGAEIEAELLRLRWATWCEAEGHRPGSSGHFSAQLLSVDPSITSVRRRPPGSRKLDTKTSYYLGITLNPESMARVRGDFLADTGELLDSSETEPVFEELDLGNLFADNIMS
jgi:phage/plasmid-associated DNA primase